MTRSRIYGPLISANSLESHEELLVRAFGMVDRGRAMVGSAETARLFGIDAKLELQVLGTPGAEAGAVICAFAAAGESAADLAGESAGAPAVSTASAPIRDEQSRIFRDAFRVIDFYAPDFDAAVAHARAAGFEMHTKEASYETNEGSFREAHHAAPDGVVAAFLHGPADFFVDFAEVRDRLASEPVSISLPLSDAGPSVDWYERLFGWKVVYEYEFADRSFSELMGLDEEFKVRSVTVGPSRQQTYVNIVDYGLPPGVGGSLLGQSVAPRRGLLGLTVLCDDLDEVVAAAGGLSEERVAPLEVPGLGVTRAAVVQAPFGAPHLVIERR